GILSIYDRNEALCDVVEIADKRNPFHQPVDQCSNAALETGFDGNSEQIDQPDHDDRAQRISHCRGIGKVEPDRKQDPPDRAVRPEISKNEGADPDDDGNRYRERQQDEKSCNESAETADHHSPTATNFGAASLGSLIGNLLVLGYGVRRLVGQPLDPLS